MIARAGARKSVVPDRTYTDSRVYHSHLAFLDQRAARWYRFDLSISSLSVDFVTQEAGVASGSRGLYCVSIAIQLHDTSSSNSYSGPASDGRHTDQQFASQ